ncbi:SH3 domain-containing protein [Polyangium aurulentum]|uniref:SH3 domain-containing protein n=1 Tax=Polyangium aurulentum TaxID=2567896 RepID=UPI0010AE10D7|nr:SH3 domain-containing protein [Polyangium aurulentum]UQA57302.1 SH3 domain-containing protein [Polyangium aurulentum]
MHPSRSLVALAALALIAGCGGEESELDYAGEHESENIGTAEQAAVFMNAKIWNTGGVALNVRSTPSTSGTIVGSVAEGTSVGIECQVNGTLVGSTTIWDYLPAYGGYVTDAYVYTGYDGFVPGMPICGSSGGGGSTPLVVNGSTLNASQDKWVRWIAKNTFPKLQGTLSQRLDVASRVTWWALKEGVLDTTNPIAYSNCDNVHQGPLYVCYGMWQAGISGIQINDKDPVEVENLALKIHAGSTIKDVLAKAALSGGFAAGTSTYNSIVNATGGLRHSWLLRESAVGFTRQDPVVNSECVVGAKSWCYGSGWYPSNVYAPTKTAALKSISDLRAIISTLTQ